MLVGEGERRLHRSVEGEDLAGHGRVVIGVGGRVDVPPLHHQEEAVVVRLEDGERLLCHRGQARLRARALALVRHRARGEEPEHLRPGRRRDGVEEGRGGHHPVPLRLGLGDEVPPVRPVALRPPRVRGGRVDEVAVSAAERDLEVRVDELARDQEFLGAVADVRVDPGRRRVGDARGRDRARRPPVRGGQFRDGREPGAARGLADHAVVGPDPGHERGRGRRRVRDGVVGRRRRYVACVVEPVHRERRGRVCCRVMARLLPAGGLDMIAAHAVADQQDHVLRAPVTLRKHRRRSPICRGNGDDRAGGFARRGPRDGESVIPVGGAGPGVRDVDVVGTGNRIPRDVQGAPDRGRIDPGLVRRVDPRVAAPDGDLGHGRELGPGDVDGGQRRVGGSTLRGDPRDGHCRRRRRNGNQSKDDARGDNKWSYRSHGLSGSSRALGAGCRRRLCGRR